MVDEPDDGMDFDELLDLAEASEIADTASIVSSLPLAYVLERAGIFVEYTGSRLQFFCPFHDDGETPAGSVFGEQFERWSCWACGAPRQGRVFDLIQQLAEKGGEVLSFPEVCDRARALILEMNESEWTGPTEGKPKKQINIDAVIYTVDRALANPDLELIDSLLEVKRLKDGPDSNRFTSEWLNDQFRVGVGKVVDKLTGGFTDAVIVPYYNSAGELITYKRRIPGEHIMAISGAGQFTNIFYNMWRTDMPEADILLVEGESDTWNAQYEVGHLYRVLGLPTGVGAIPKDLTIFKDKTVLLALDADGDREAGTKGRGATDRWVAALKSVNANVRIVPIPDEKDISACASILQSLCSAARPIITPLRGLRISENGYTRAGKDSDVVISNFIFKPIRELVGSEHVAYEGVILPGGVKTIIADYDLKNKNNFVAWCLRHRGLAWSGSDRDVAILLSMFQAESTYLPIGHMASVAGLHNNHFVWPGGQVGPEPWHYVPPPTDTDLASVIDIHPGTWSPEYVHTLRNIHKRHVTDPILAWLAIAPLRPLLKEFPILAVSGPHGSGKTRTIETMVRAFTGTYIATTLTGTTPHAIIGAFAATNSFPAIFEERRPGAGEAALKTVDQMARDAYTMQRSQKGGMKGDWAAVSSIVPCAPAIISGEDTFTEGSHVERMILLQLFRDGQNPDAFATANAWKNNGLPFAYLTWLHKSLFDGSLNNMTIVPDGPFDLGARQRINIGILNLGWKLLQMFMEDAQDSLDSPNFSMVVTELREANTHTPVEDAIRWCLGEVEAGEFIFVEEGMVHVRVENFVSFINERTRRGDSGFILPGKHPAIKKYLQMKFEAKEVIKKKGGLTKSFLAFPVKGIAR